MTGQGALLAAFITQAGYRPLEWLDYIGFALAVTFISGAPLASHALGLVAPRLAGATGKYAYPAPQPPPPTAGPTVQVDVHQSAPPGGESG